MKRAISSLLLLLATSLPALANEPAASAASAAVATSATSSAESGLIIKDIKAGSGVEATPGRDVEVHYTGWLHDANAKGGRGKQFDSSVGRGVFTFPLGGGRVIKGWDVGVMGMKEGGKRTLIIPADLAYGQRNIGNGLIPPNSTLVFDVELIKVR